MKNYKIASLLAVTITMFSLFAPAAQALPVPNNFRYFLDVDDNHQYANEINWLAERNIVRGSNGYFYPENTITRGEFTAIVIRSKFSQNEINSCVMYGATNGMVFADVPTSHTFAGEICLAKQKSVVSGYSNGMFGPGDLVTYQQSAKIVVNTYRIGWIDSSASLPNYSVVLENFGYVPPTITGGVMSDVNLKRKEAAYLVYKGMNHNSSIVPSAPWKYMSLANTILGASGNVTSYSTFQIPATDKVFESIWVGGQGYIRTRALYGDFTIMENGGWTMIDKTKLNRYLKLPANTDFSVIAQTESVLGGNEVFQAVWIKIKNSDGSYSAPKGYMRYLPYNSANGGINWDVEFSDPIGLTTAMDGVFEVKAEDNIVGQSGVFLARVNRETYNRVFGKAINYEIAGVYAQDIVITRSNGQQAIYRHYVPVKFSDGRPDFASASSWMSVNISDLKIFGTLPPRIIGEYDKYVIPTYNTSGNYGILVENVWVGNTRYMRATNIGANGLPVVL